MIVVVTGGRNFDDWDRVEAVLDALTRQRRITRLAHGGARGADSLAGKWARSRGIEEEIFPAQWDTYGKAAGMIRNRTMLDGAHPDLVVAFAGGVGTNGCVHEARKRNLTVLDLRGNKD